MHYELMTIIPPGTTQEANTRLEELKGVVSKAGGKVINATSWGERPFAYRIQKHLSGVYFLLDLDMPQHAVASLSKALNLREEILRSMITVKPTPKVITQKEPVKATAPQEQQKTADLEL